MLKGNRPRRGIDDRPVTKEELKEMRKGGSLYRRVEAPKRPTDLGDKNRKVIASAG